MTEFEEAIRRQAALLWAIQDSYHRMATQPDERYRITQREKCNDWLLELTELYRDHPQLLAV